MYRFAWAGASAVLLSGCTLYFGVSDDQPDTNPEPTGERMDRECLSGVVSGELVAQYWNHDELFITWGCQGMTGETISWGPTAVVSLFGTMFPAFLEPIRVQDGWAMTIADHRELLRFGTGFPMTSFEHALDDVVRLDFDGNGTMDFVTSGDAMMRRAAVPSEYYTTIAAANETTLLSGKPYHYLAVANLSGSTLPDIFYTTKLGQFGIATQTSPDQFTDQVLGSGVQPQRLHVADVDGDGQGDVVGASPSVFIYSTKAQALVQLPDKARAIAVGDIDGDGVAEPVFLTENGLQVRRVVGLTAPGTQVSKVVLNTTEAQALTVANMDGDQHGDIALVHEAGQATSWLELRRAISFGF
jgi:hypothetical protein